MTLTPTMVAPSITVTTSATDENQSGNTQPPNEPPDRQPSRGSGVPGGAEEIQVTIPEMAEGADVTIKMTSPTKIINERPHTEVTKENNNKK